MRGLVVAIVLRSDGEAVLRIVHQGVEAALRGDGSGIYAQGVVGDGTEDDFLAPVAEDVGGEAGGGFAAVVGGAALGDEQV